MIAIKTINELPKGCYGCVCEYGGWCYAIHTGDGTTFDYQAAQDIRPHNCPLVVVADKEFKGGDELDGEKVVEGLCAIREFFGFGLPSQSPVFESYKRILTDAITKLKEQEPIEPTINEYGEAYCVCGENVGIIPRDKNLPSIRSKYCSECGRRMKWNEH